VLINSHEFPCSWQKILNRIYKKNAVEQLTTNEKGYIGNVQRYKSMTYFEVGTMLTPNHGHAAMMGVFGMLAITLMVFSMRHVSTDAQWNGLEKYVMISFWGLNIGLMMMVIFSMFPGGVLQLLDVLNNGYWHARSLAYTGQYQARLIEWLRTPGDVVFILVGVLPLLYAVSRCYLNLRNQNQAFSEHVEQTRI